MCKKKHITEKQFYTKREDTIFSLFTLSFWEGDFMLGRSRIFVSLFYIPLFYLYTSAYHDYILD